MSDNEIGCLGIDPGSRFMGVSWVICNENFTKIVHAEAVTVAAVSGLDKQLRKTHDDRFARLELIGDGLSKYLNGKDVRYASTEASFVNPRMKSAVIPLTLAIGKATDVIYKLYPTVYLRWISPNEVKNAVGVKGGNKKEGIAAGVTTAFAEFGYTVDLTGLSEHALDGHAVNMANIKLLRKIKGV